MVQYYSLDTSDEIAQIQFTNDNGTTWNTVWEGGNDVQTSDERGWHPVVADITNFCINGGTHKIRIRIDASGTGDYFYVSHLSVVLDDSTPWYLMNFNNINVANNVGIGTTNPIERLDVNGCINITPGTGTSWSGETSNSYIKFAGGSIGNDWAVLRQIGSSNAIHLSLDFHDDNNETGFSIRDCHSTASGDPVYTRFMVKRGGNVGIGTNNPGYTLDVNGDAYIRGNSLWLKGAGDDAAQRPVSYTHLTLPTKRIV